jgi:hypothetical protein
MQQRFPVVRGAAHDWVVAANELGLRFKVVEALMDQHIRAGQLLVEVHRKIGDYLAKDAALAFVATHLGEGEIRIADRDFTGFVLIAQNWVATGWRAASPAVPAEA